MCDTLCHASTSFRSSTDGQRTRHRDGGIALPAAFTLRRCQILLASARQEHVPAIARALGCNTQTVRNAIHAFNQSGLDALTAGSSRPQRITAGGRWLKMTGSRPRLRTRCALHGQHPTQPGQSSDAVEATARGWNRAPTPFVWGGRRAARRARARARYHTAGGSGARVLRPIRRRETITEQWRYA